MAGQILTDNLDDFYLTITASKDGTPKGDATVALSLADKSQGGIITGMTGNGVNPIVVTSVAHGLNTSDLVCLMNVVGNKAANGPKTVTKIDANTFSIGVAGTGAWIDTTDADNDDDKPWFYKTVAGVHNESMSVYDSDTGEYRIPIERSINLIIGRDYIAYAEISYPAETGVDVRQISLRGAAPRQ